MSRDGIGFYSLTFCVFFAVCSSSQALASFSLTSPCHTYFSPPLGKMWVSSTLVSLASLSEAWAFHSFKKWDFSPLSWVVSEITLWFFFWKKKKVSCYPWEEINVLFVKLHVLRLNTMLEMHMKLFSGVWLEVIFFPPQYVSLNWAVLMGIRTPLAFGVAWKNVISLPVIVKSCSYTFFEKNKFLEKNESI